MDDSRRRPADRSARPRPAASPWRYAKRTTVVFVLGLCLLGFGAAATRASVIEQDQRTLVFSGGVYSVDSPGLARTVTMTQGGGSLLIESSDEIVPRTPEIGARCPYVDQAEFNAVACRLTGITDLIVLTGSGDDHHAVGTTLPTVLCGGPGDDVIAGGPAVDLLAGAAGNDVLSGGGGNDFLRADHQSPSSGTAPWCSAEPADPPGNNRLEGGAGADLVVGDEGDDILHGGGDDDVVFGRPGADEIHGDDGDDLLAGQDDADTLDGGLGLDVLSGGAGTDRLNGGAGADDLAVPILLTVDRGGPVEASVETGADGMYGGEGDDTLFGGPGDRTVNYGLDMGQRAPGRAEANGADVFSGGDGQDHVSYVNREIPISVTLDGRPNDGASGEGDDVASDVERVTGGVRDDVILGGPGGQALNGGPGSDTLAGFDGADALDGGAGDAGADNLAGGAGPDTLSGGPGADVLSGGHDGDALRGGGGTDRLSGDEGDDDMHGEADADEVVGGPGADVVDGGQGVDLADYSAATAAVNISLDGLRNDGERGEDWVQQVENVRAGAGPDTLVGDALVNQLDGGGGDDLIDGGAGQDVLSGGAGADALRAREGLRDAVACGTGRDVAVIDELDVLRAGRERCERADTGRRARSGEALVRPVGCRLEVRLPGMSRRLPLEESLSVPRMTTIDAGRCAAILSTRRGTPRVRAVGGTMVLRRSGSRRRVLSLRLGGGRFTTCRQKPSSRVVRRLSIRTSGRVRVKARFATAIGASRRAAWTMSDHCRRTLTRVRQGAVRVLDAGRRRNVTVRAGHRHVSVPRRPGRG
jgi:Ca2+-binding RTX toxin-like protein